LLNSQYLYAEALRAALRDTQSWLDLGCGHQLLPAWMGHQSMDLPAGARLTVGIDLDADALRSHNTLRRRIRADVEQLPVAAASFDLVTANMVLEHVRNAELLFYDVSRVLKPGGSFLIHTPNLAGYTTILAKCTPGPWRPKLAALLQGRQESDVYRTFYRANTIHVLRALAAGAQLDVAELQTVASSPQLYKVPLLGALEERLLRLLQRERWARWRPCIIARFVRLR